jgi:putative ABC transport system permease protein
MTALGIGLTVAVLLAVMALVEGLGSAFRETGDPQQVLVVRKGAQSELVSNLEPSRFQDLKTMPGIARNANGDPLASLEMVTTLNLASVNNEQGNNVNLRGVLPVGIEMRPGLKLVEGRWFRTGQREIVVGRNVAKRYPDGKLGQKLRFGKGDWEIVGVMEAGQSAVNSEVFGDLNQVSTDFDRAGVLSSALVRASDMAEVNSLINRIKADQRLNLAAMSEKEYYAQQTDSAIPIKYLGTFVAIVMAVGSCFAAMNTMYAAVAKRAREIGTLRVLGFSRGGILTSFFFESLLLSVLGGLAGILLVLPLNGVTTNISSWTTFSDVAFDFRVTPAIMLTGMMFALVMGAAGGLLPARSASRKEILNALRDA